ITVFTCASASVDAQSVHLSATITMASGFVAGGRAQRAPRPRRDLCDSVGVRIVRVVQIALCGGVLDAVAQLRAGPGARGIATGLTDLREIRAPLGRRGAPLHSGVTGSQPPDGDRDVTERAIRRQQPRRQVALTIGAGG